MLKSFRQNGALFVGTEAPTPLRRGTFGLVGRFGCICTASKVFGNSLILLG
jgi:hypothetical protein